MDPRLSFAWSNLGVALGDTGSIEAAEAAYKHSLKVNSAEFTAMINLARLYTKTGRPELAEPFLKKANNYRKRNPYYHYNLGQDAYDGGHYEVALVHFKRAVRRKPKEHEFHFALAKVYANLGDRKNLASSLKRAAQFAPGIFDKNRYSQKLDMLASKR